MIHQNIGFKFILIPSVKLIMVPAYLSHIFIDLMSPCNWCRGMTSRSFTPASDCLGFTQSDLVTVIVLALELTLPLCVAQSTLI